MNCKPGTIGYINKNSRAKENIGAFVEVIRPYVDGEILPGHITPYDDEGVFGWVVKSMGAGLLVTNRGGNYRAQYAAYRDKAITPFRDAPGNEDFVVKARKTLPRAKPVTGPVTINTRGEPA